MSRAGTPRKRRRWWLWTALLSPLWLPLLFYGCIRLAHPNAGPRNIRVSPETTHVTGPLAEDGFVDYVAAINAHASEGVTPEDNAVVLLARVFDLSEELSPALREEFYGQVEMETPSAGEGFFVPHDRFFDENKNHIPEPESNRDSVSNSSEQLLLEREQADELAKLEVELNAALTERDWSAFHSKCQDVPFKWMHGKEDVFERQLNLATFVPWKKEHYPTVAAWLEMNEKPLELLVEASRRPRLFAPLVTDATSARLLMAESPLLMAMSDSGAVLVIRAMLHLGNNDPAAAWEDILAAHRLARLAGQHPTFFGGMVATRLENAARNGDVALASFHGLSPELIMKIRREIKALPRATDTIEKIDVGERMQLLDNIVSLARGDFGDEQPSLLGQHWNDSIVNWNNILRGANETIDQFVTMARMPPGDEKRKMSENLFEESERILAEAESPVTYVTSAFVGSQLEKVFKGTAQELLHPILLKSALRMDAKDKQDADLTKLALNIAHFYTDQGAYPDSLDELAPRYLYSIPRDPLHGMPYLYRKTETGFVVYGVGANGQDDGGAPLLVNGREEYENTDHVLSIPPRIDIRDRFELY